MINHGIFNDFDKVSISLLSVLNWCRSWNGSRHPWHKSSRTFMLSLCLSFCFFSSVCAFSHQFVPLLLSSCLFSSVCAFSPQFAPFLPSSCLISSVCPFSTQFAPFRLSSYPLFSSVRTFSPQFIPFLLSSCLFSSVRAQITFFKLNSFRELHEFHEFILSLTESEWISRSNKERHKFKTCKTITRNYPPKTWSAKGMKDTKERHELKTYKTITRNYPPKTWSTKHEARNITDIVDIFG